MKIQGPGGKPVQVESITMSWCTYDKALEYIQETLRGEYDHAAFAREVNPAIETPEQHGRCHLCM